MEKRVFLAIFLCFAVLAVYQWYFAPKPTDVPPGTTTSATAPGATPAATGAPSPTPSPTGGAPPPAAAEAQPAAKAIVSDTAAHEIVVDTDTVHAVFSSAGATLVSWQLKKYRAEDGT